MLGLGIPFVPVPLQGFESFTSLDFAFIFALFPLSMLHSAALFSGGTLSSGYFLSTQSCMIKTDLKKKTLHKHTVF